MAKSPSCFFGDVTPREPFTKELVNMPPRSPYLDAFIVTWTFTGTGLLVVSGRYAAAALLSERWTTNRQLATDFLHFLLLVSPFAVCVLDFVTEKYREAALLFNAVSCLCCLAAVAHRMCNLRQLGVAAKVPAASEQQQKQQLPAPAKPFNSVASQYRGIVYICTAFCIFARDLPCWQNTFSKTYSFGTGLMDVGIGCFVVCVGLVGPTASTDVRQLDRRAVLHKTLFYTFVLCLCGLVKTSIEAVKIRLLRIHFEEIWLEYGLHWNAFYSLAGAKLLGTLVELFALPRRLPPLALAAVLWLLQELLLAAWLAKAVLAPGQREPYNRSNLIGQNREGISSLLGIVPLYLLGLQLGRWCRQWCVDRSRRSLLLLCCRLLLLLLLALCYRLLLCSQPSLLLPESRRLFNPSYCQWIAAFSAFCLLNSCVVVLLQDFFGLEDGAVSEHLLQLDRCGLMYFLVSQFLTGAGNGIVSLAFRDRESMGGFACFVAMMLYMWAAFVIARWAQARVNLAKAYDALRH